MDSWELLAYPLAPSELVLLHAEHFAPLAETELTKVTEIAPFPDKPAVSAMLLVTCLVAAALLAGEQAGSLTLTLGQRRTWLGLWRRPALYLQSGSVTGSWPAHSLEAQFDRQLARSISLGTVSLDMVQLLRQWAALDKTKACLGMVERIQQGLAARGLLQLVQNRRPNTPVQRSYLIPSATRALANNGPWSNVQSLLAQGQQTRPMVWEQLSAATQRIFSSP